jgi:hypothetical protein
MWLISLFFTKGLLTCASRLVSECVTPNILQLFASPSPTPAHHTSLTLLFTYSISNGPKILVLFKPSLDIVSTLRWKIPGFWIRIPINLSCWTRIGIQKGKNDQQKLKKSFKKVSSFQVLDVLFRGLKGVLYGGLGISKLKFLTKKFFLKTFSCKIV